MKLWLVKTRGLQVSLVGNVTHGLAYVVAEDSDAAYKKLRTYLDEKNIGHTRERELESVRLIADSKEYPPCGARLYL